MLVRAPAKINLALSVGPPQPPKGYHPIASVLACIDLADDLLIERLPEDAASTFSIAWAPDAPRPFPIDWPIDKDLAVRAHRLLEVHVGRPLPVSLKLSKRIPVGAGLGGGSSDAAAMLLALNSLFDLRLSHSQLSALGAQLGSDVAFFLDAHADIRHPTSDIPLPRPAVVTGLGERIDRIAPPAPLDLLLLLPPFGCPTGPVYQAFDRLLTPAHTLREPAIRAIAAAYSAGNLDPAALFNDLAAAAEHVAPDLFRLRCTAAPAAGAPVHVTGSGSAMFVLLPARGNGPASVAATAERIRNSISEFAVLTARTI